jgi:Putative DNA-binding domain
VSRLAQQQQALLATLFAQPSQDASNLIAPYLNNPWARGLKAYQANAHAMAQQALQVAYPVLAQMLGAENLGALARAFWHAAPPLRGDLAHWGGGLADFVRSHAQLSDEPYLADVATVEWALHRCATAPDQALDAASFGLLAQHDPGEVKLCLSPGCVVTRSRYPLASLMSAHRQGSPSMADLATLLRAGVQECAVVWRQGLQPQVAQCSEVEAAFLQATLDGASVLASLERAGDLDLGQWLPAAAQNGLLLGAQRLKGLHTTDL